MPIIPMVTPEKPASTVTPPSSPDIIRITAPEGVDRWEPSGAVAHGDRLWVVNDRDGWLVAYDLPLKPGRNGPTVAHQVIVQPGKIKFEGLAPVGDSGLLLLETMKRSVAATLERTGALADCRALAHEHIRLAIECLDRFADGPAKTALITVAEATAHRER